MFQPSSPTRRRESTPLLEKLKTDVAAARIKILSALEKGQGGAQETRETQGGAAHTEVHQNAGMLTMDLKGTAS